jgi:20S proteasome alpha/beta subunit
MTLILALKWLDKEGEGAVISSDSRATVGPVSYEARKVYPIILKSGDDYVPLAVAGGAGDASIIKQCYRVCEKILIDMAAKEWHNCTPSFSQFEDK